MQEGNFQSTQKNERLRTSPAKASGGRKPSDPSWRRERGTRVKGVHITLGVN